MAQVGSSSACCPGSPVPMRTEKMLQSCSCGSVHKHQPQQPMMAEPLITLSSSKVWLKPTKHPTLSTDLCNVSKPNPASLCTICTDQLQLSPPEPPAALQPQPWKSQLAARENCKGESLVEESMDTANPPSPTLPVPTALSYSHPLGRVVIAFYVMNKE